MALLFALTTGCETGVLVEPSDGGLPTDTGQPDTGSVELDAGADAGMNDADIPPDHCAEVDAFGPGHDWLIDRWAAQDDLAAWPESPVVFVGSSSIRRWDWLARAYADFTPVQRGFGGAQLAEVALRTERLINRHRPKAVVVFAGTNDLAAGVDVETVLERFRCLRQRIGSGSGVDTPIIFIGITPTPSRWAGWTDTAAVNDAIAAMASEDPAIYYADIPSAFLAMGSPPSLSLFAEDQLHLSASGYALWHEVLRPVVEAAIPASPVAGAQDHEPGMRILMDFGPNTPDDGEHTPSPDYLGQRWNNWHALGGNGSAVPGEHLRGLVTSNGDVTSVGLVLTGEFIAVGFQSGGLRWPDEALLGDLAVGSATGDFFYPTGETERSGFYLTNLDPSRRYTLKIFGGRDHGQRRVTTYEVSGAIQSTQTLQTSGPGAGTEGATINNRTSVEFAGLQADPWGHLFVDVSVLEGDYAYLSLFELVAE